MATAKIVPIGPPELDLVVELYNNIFSPTQDAVFFERRYQGKQGVSTLLATLDDEPAGLVVGYELTPTTYYCWFCGVLPDHRRKGIATQLMQAQQAWAKDHHYAILRFECQNQHRPMLHTAISEGYDLIGIRWDTNSAANMVIFEKELP